MLPNYGAILQENADGELQPPSTAEQFCYALRFLMPSIRTAIITYTATTISTAILGEEYKNLGLLAGFCWGVYELAWLPCSSALSLLGHHEEVEEMDLA